MTCGCESSALFFVIYKARVIVEAQVCNKLDVYLFLVEKQQIPITYPLVLLYTLEINVNKSYVVYFKLPANYLHKRCGA
jgi:hypothetical protein